MVINQEMGMGMGIARASERRSSQSEIYLILGRLVGRPVHGVFSASAWCACLILFRGRTVEFGLRVRHNSRACKVILGQSVSQSVSQQYHFLNQVNFTP